MINNPLEYIVKKYALDLTKNSPIYINEDRDGLALLFKEIDYITGAEIGVYSGLFSETLCKTIPNLELFCVDPWKKYEGYNDVRGEQERYDRIYEQAKKRLAPFKCHLIKRFSVDASKVIPDGSLDFVYIDGNHDYEHCVEDIAAWIKKVKIGGIISGHDFRHINSEVLRIHVLEAITAWTNAYQIAPWFILDKDKKAPSWIWVKTK